MKVLKLPILNNTNLANWLILASFFVFLVTSCTTPQSVGYNMKKKNPQKNKPLEVDVNKESMPETQTNTKIPEQNINLDRLPTLREQMKLIADKQIEIEVDVDIIKSEISIIKAELVELKSNLMTEGRIDQKQIVAGETHSKPKKPTQKQIDEETYLLPDEAVQTVPSKKTNLPTNSKPTPKQENKQSRMSNPVEIKTEKTSENNEFKVQETNNDKLIIHNNVPIKDSDTYEKVKLAESLANSGKKDEARKIYQDILKQNPKNELTPLAKKMLQQL